MKKTLLALLTTTLLVFGCVLSCKQNDEQPLQSRYLLKGQELAQQLNGLYFSEGSVSSAKATDNGQELLQLVLTNGGIKPHTATVFLEQKDWKQLEVKSGTYEVLYLRHMLILNNPETGLRYTFRVSSEELAALESKLPENYTSSPAIEAIGISFRGPLPTLKGNPELTDDCYSSGGPGTISCSNSCCSVTCKSGYYATCGKSCNCTKED